MASLRKCSAIQNPFLRKLATAVLREFRRTGSAAHNENLKHVLRMVTLLRAHSTELVNLGIDPERLEVAILVSDMGKEPHFIERNLKRYGNNPFRAFMDHARISMREGNRLRRRIGVPDRLWREILKSIIGHDGPSVEGSWWKIHYEGELKRPYPELRTVESLIHCYLDRMDQGGIFRGRGQQLNGGLRKISYDLYQKGPNAGDLAAVVREVFSSTRKGTYLQLNHLDQVEKVRLLGKRDLPEFLRAHRREFDAAEAYFDRVGFTPGQKSVEIRLDDGERVQVHGIDEFWRTLSRVTPDGRFSSVPLRSSAV